MSSISSVSGYSQMNYAKQLFSKMDADGSGGISQQEFVSARPSDVSETSATELFNKLDSAGTGSLSESDLSSMESDKKGSRGTGLASLDDSTLMALMQSLSGTSTTTSSSTESSGLTDMIAAMDTDSNGTVTKEEFLAARPDDVSEEMATNLWSQFDTEGAGSLSTSDLKTAMASGAPEGGMTQMAGMDSAYDPLQALLDELTSDSTASLTGSSSSSSSFDSNLQALLEAIKTYESSAGYGNTKEVLSSLLTMA